MTRLSWGDVGERFYEAGIDRGVLYVGVADGVPWNGLVAVSESPSGEEIQSYYIDGIKYLHLSSGEEFEATIEAFTYPEEFSPCIGESPVTNGLFATQQRKQTFGLSYRSKIGNDLEGLDHAYKIHLVYNALAESSERNNSTLNDGGDVDNFSWHVTTKPPSPLTISTGYKPTAHFMIDTRGIDAALVSQIEDILYGTVDNPPRLPSVSELITIFYTYGDSEFDGGTPPGDYVLTIDGGTP